MAAFSPALNATIEITDFSKPRAGPIGPEACPACAVIAKIMAEVRDIKDPELLSMCVELGTRHIAVGHPWDFSTERRFFLTRLDMLPREDH
ncbi:hypothetical protein ACIOUE_38200 [Streptomyces xanthochromogenes]|uniref:hypothetical protein n=1 Tax=Streptomyces xanthochromogenes TaxID=67384 RepID=UPI0037F67550